MSEDGPGGAFPDDRDLTAAEHVIGLLTPAEARAVELRAIEDPVLARRVLAWQRRLSGMTRWVRPVEPPASAWPRLEAEVMAQPAPQTQRSRNAGPGRQGWLRQAWESLAFWRGATVAALLTLDAPTPAFVVMVTKDGYATIIANAAEVQPGNSRELWGLPPGAAAPASLGVIPATGQIRMAVTVSAGTLLLVSPEPKGGSPTGPMMYRGRMVKG